MDSQSAKVQAALAALPADLDEDAPAGPDLASLLTRLSHRPLPVGRWHRIWILGSLQARVAAGYMAHWLRSGWADADAKQASLNEARLSAALKLIGGMSYMRGAVMKFGQTMATWPDVVPEEVAELLSVLHFQAPPMHFSMLREMVHDELGADPSELFAEFDTEAFAAASIGQVHRARLHSGEEVAVKIQYPGIAQSIRSDLENFQLLMAPMRLGKNWANLMEQTEDIRKKLDQEMDYRQEAALHKEAAQYFEQEEHIVVPRVHEEFSSGRVLVTDYLPGVHMDEWLEQNPSEAQRSAAGEAILTTSFRLWFSGNLIYADPHPGNFIFMPDGRLGVIDFGGLHRLNEEEQAYCELAEQCMHGGKDVMDRLIALSTNVQHASDLTEEHQQFIRDLSDWIWEPILHEGPYDFGATDYCKRGADLMAEIFRKRYTRSRTVNTWINRSFYGDRALMHRLSAKVDMGAIQSREADASRAG